jgi:hypothetical protein
MGESAQEAGMGPDHVGDEFDETDEEGPQDPGVVYDIVDVNEGVLSVTSQLNDVVSLQIDGDDVIIEIEISEDPSGESATQYTMVVPKSAFVEALRDIGILLGSHPSV